MVIIQNLDIMQSASPFNLGQIQNLFKKKFRRIKFICYLSIEIDEKNFLIPGRQNTELSYIFKASLVNLNWLWYWLHPGGKSTPLYFLW